MSDYVLGARIELKDKFTSVVDSAGKKFKDFESIVDKHSDKITSSVRSMGSAFSRINTTALKGVATAFSAISVAGVGALGYGTKLAADLEKYRNTLSVVLKDEEKAKNKMIWANDFANVTPFETGEVVESVVKLESYGIDSNSSLKSIGDMAAAMGKPLMQAVEAMADAQTGELERLKEFGITKNMIEEHSKVVGSGNLINAKGQITDIKAFNKVLKDLMILKFGDAMEKQSKSFYGAMSTNFGILKSSFAQVMGMGKDGEVVTGSAFDYIRNKAVGFSDYLMKLQKDGTLERWTQNIGNKFEEIAPYLESFVKTLKEKFEDGSITNSIKAIGSAFGAVASALGTVSQAILNFNENGLLGVVNSFDKVNNKLKIAALAWATLSTAINTARVAAGDMTALPGLMASGGIMVGLGATYGAKGIDKLIKSATGNFEEEKTKLTVKEALGNDKEVRRLIGDSAADERLTQAYKNELINGNLKSQTQPQYGPINITPTLNFGNFQGDNDKLTNDINNLLLDLGKDIEETVLKQQ